QQVFAQNSTLAWSNNQPLFPPLSFNNTYGSYQFPANQIFAGHPLQTNQILSANPFPSNQSYAMNDKKVTENIDINHRDSLNSKTKLKMRVFSLEQEVADLQNKLTSLATRVERSQLVTRSHMEEEEEKDERGKSQRGRKKKNNGAK
ncbi:MAG TPA: hypothetical protein PLS50_05760, partial [Candidatus Dojkabacteria bacterium]|nr:hypothetical protein [Candidatus Dojkabacteria bacterium]